MSKYILITGGAGFIGSKVSYDLIGKNYKIIILDDLSSGFLEFIQKNSIFIKADIKNYNDTKKKLIKYKNKIEAVFHFAASLSVEESNYNPMKYYNNNILGTENILKLASYFNIKKFIFSSTCAVYGNLEKTKISEKDITIPISNYGKTKLFSEIMIKEFSKKYKFKYAILRYFNVIGADKHLRSGLILGKSLFKNLSKNIVNKKFTINLYGNNYNTRDGSCIRDYIDVNDLSKLHVLSMSKLNKSKSFILNCGYNKGYSVKEIVKIFSKIIKKNIKIRYCNKRRGDVKSIYCDNKKLKNIFPNWKREFSIKTSIENMIKWEKKLLN